MSILKKYYKKVEAYFNAIEYMYTLGDIFKPVLGKGIDLKKVIDTLSKK